MNILITGASGFIGTHLTKDLTSQGHHVYAMKRNHHRSSSISNTSPHIVPNNEPFYWSPSQNQIHYDKSILIDVVIHLAGAGIADKRWTPARKKVILESRTQGTQLLAQTLADLSLQLRPKLFLSSSGIGYYGNTGDQTATETTSAGSDFISDICKQWEAATQPAQDAGIPTVHLRTGLVLSTQGGALSKMLIPFKLGLGGRIGNGKQYMSWISLSDYLRAITFLVNQSEDNGEGDGERIQNAVNFVSPHPISNAEFSKHLAKSLGRPCLFPLPAIVSKIILGEMAESLLLTSNRIVPQVLLNSGFQFEDIDCFQTLKSLNATGQ